jgi:hypothetical protein
VADLTEPAPKSLLKQRPLVALLAAETVSSLGTHMTYLALPWFVLVTTGSATKMSVVVGAELLGVAAFGVPGAKVLGRLGARRTMMLCDGIRAGLRFLARERVLRVWTPIFALGDTAWTAFVSVPVPSGFRRRSARP